MSVSVPPVSSKQLESLGFKVNNTIHYQLSPEELVQDALRLGEGELNDTGALVINTGEFTGRSPKDKFTVKDEKTADTLNCNNFNQPIEEDRFDIIKQKITTYLDGKKELWVRDCYACADQRY